MNGANFSLGNAVPVVATATDLDGTVTQVAFFANGTPIAGCVDTTAPYECSWTPTTLGTHSLTAQATDTASAAKLSELVNVTVNEPANQPPAVAISSPANGANFVGGNSITIEATADDGNGTVTQVAFFANGVAIAGCIDTTAPYACTWTPPLGNHALTDQATDNQGGVGASTVVNITINDASNQPPTVSLTSPTVGSTLRLLKRW